MYIGINHPVSTIQCNNTFSLLNERQNTPCIWDGWEDTLDLNENNQKLIYQIYQQKVSTLYIDRLQFKKMEIPLPSKSYRTPPNVGRKEQNITVDIVQYSNHELFLILCPNFNHS